MNVFAISTILPITLLFLSACASTVTGTNLKFSEPTTFASQQVKIKDTNMVFTSVVAIDAKFEIVSYFNWFIAVDRETRTPMLLNVDGGGYWGCGLGGYTITLPDEYFATTSHMRFDDSNSIALELMRNMISITKEQMVLIIRFLDSDVEKLTIGTRTQNIFEVRNTNTNFNDKLLVFISMCQ